MVDEDFGAYDRDKDDWDAEDYEGEIADASDDEEKMREENDLIEYYSDGRICPEDLDPEDKQMFIKQFLTEEEYDEFIAEYGSPQPEKVPAKDRHESVCWQDHHEALSSKKHLRDRTGCGWLVCYCGSCWCNMPPEMQAQYRVWWEYVPGATCCPECNAYPVKIRAGKVVRCNNCKGKGWLRPEPTDDLPF
jgi:hypothetical protein